MPYKDKIILITGGTGTFGTAFIQNFLKKYSPKRIRIYSRDEYKQSLLLENPYYGGMIDGFIGDVRDKDRLRRAMEGVDIVLHAAALKRVQSCEYNPFETIKTNILGSMNVIDCAIDEGVEKVLAISTDKAVSPLNLYGATKMCMEKLFIQGNSYCGKRRTKISCVRYGNVAGSRGSVIPLWRNFLMQNKPILITNPKSTRFWLDIEHAISFVMDCLELMDVHQGGNTYIPKIPSVNLMDLYHAMCDGYAYEVIGDRVGDKLHETLISDTEMQHTVDIGDKYVIQPQNPQWEYYHPKGQSCANTFSYRSDNNERFLTIEEIKERLAKVV